MPKHESPARRAWRRFRANRLGYTSLLIFSVLFGVSLLAEVLSNDRPLAVRYEGTWYFPVVQTIPETTFGGDFATPTDYLDPLIQQNEEVVFNAGRLDRSIFMKLDDYIRIAKPQMTNIALRG